MAIKRDFNLKNKVKSYAKTELRTFEKVRSFAQISLFKVLGAKILKVATYFFCVYRTLDSTFYKLNFKLLITMETQNPSEIEPTAYFHKCAQFNFLYMI